MSDIIWAEGFEHYGAGSGALALMESGLWTDTLGSGTHGPINDGTARTGTYYYQLNTNANNIRRSIGLRTLLGIAFGMRFPALSANNSQSFQIRNASNSAIFTFVWKSDGSIEIRQGSISSGTILTTTEQVFSAGTWHHVEIVARVSETVGSIEVRVDGDVAAIISDMDFGTTEMAQIIWINQTASGVIHHLDDIVAHTGEDFIGPARVITEFLEADGSPIDWNIIGTSQAFDALDELVPDEDTSYLQAEFVGNVAQFPMPELPADVTEIVGIHIPFRAKQVEAGLTRVQTTIFSGDASVSGEEHPITTSYTYSEDAFSENPDTLAPWDKASFEAATLQIERTV